MIKIKKFAIVYSCEVVARGIKEVRIKSIYHNLMSGLPLNNLKIVS